MTETLPVAPTPSLPGALIYQVLAGSHAYGLAGPGSDVDWRGIYQLPTDAYLGLRLPGKHGAPETVELPVDQVYRELRHFASLILAGNPSVMELLWTDEALVTVSSPVAQALRDVRGRYLHTKMLAAYFGWTKSEKMKLTEKGLLPDLGGKRGSHLLRVLISLRHALVDKHLAVTLTGADREQVLAVKRGLLTPQQALAEIEALEHEVRALAERATWPDPDPAPLNQIVMAARRGEL